MTDLVYLASPYSAPTKALKAKRYRQVCKKAARLMEQGNLVFCPIAHSHSVETHGMSDLKSGDWWLQQDFAVLEKCTKMVVYKMPGWEDSYGIRKEIDFANEHGIPVEYLDGD